jgi:hypothetical protein
MQITRNNLDTGAEPRASAYVFFEPGEEHWHGAETTCFVRNPKVRRA